jgi:hypothetical protein
MTPAVVPPWLKLASETLTNMEKKMNISSALRVSIPDNTSIVVPKVCNFTFYFITLMVGLL